MALANIRIVLVRPTHPGNIGATARAMKNMCLPSLYLVAPERYPDPEANARSSGADDVLDCAVVCGSLDEALRDCHLVIGSSSRARRIEWPILAPPEGAQKLVTAAEQGQVALVFGQERMGLTNPELDRCHFVVMIPSNPDYPALNLACAVQILAYEIYRSTRTNQPAAAQRELVGDADMQGLYRHLEQVLHQTGFLDPDNPRLLMRRLMRLFNRAALDHNELNILRGILTAVQNPRPRT